MTLRFDGSYLARGTGRVPESRQPSGLTEARDRGVNAAAGKKHMQFGMIGLGRMGGNMARRLMRGGHELVVYDRSAEAVQALVKDGATGAASLGEFVGKLTPPRAACLMVPAAYVDGSIAELTPLLAPGDTLIDGGNSNHEDDIARAKRLSSQGIHYVDMGTSGGVWGLERGYCLMIGGEQEVVRGLDPIFATLAPGAGDVARTPGRSGPPSTAERGYLHCGPAGAGHFVKMIHNGIEYGLMAAYAEGLNVLSSAALGKATAHAHDAETTPLRHPEHYRYDFDLASITEVWRRGSVVASWLLDLTAQALAADPALDRFGGKVSDSGEGRWTLAAANDLGVPAHVLAAALFERFASRDLDLFQNKVLSAMRFGFGGHLEKK
jgi:6-phosphogluconate dehydrogenase